MLCASPTYLAEYGVPGSPAELAAHKCIFPLPATGLIQPWELRGMRRRRFQGRCRDDGQSLRPPFA